MNEEQIHHLIDLVEMDITLFLMNDESKRSMSDSQKSEAVIFNRDLIIELQKGL